jgi:hypothetical protein
MAIYFNLSTNQVINTKKYGHFVGLSFKKITLFKSYLLQPFRLKEKVLLFLFLSLNSVYALIQTKPLRRLQKITHSYHVIKNYTYLIGANVSFMMVVSLPFLLAEVIIAGDFLMLVLFLGSAVCSVIYLSMIGILFPPIHDNPISIAIGTVFLVMMTVIFLLVTIFLQLSFVMPAVSLIFFTMVIAMMSVYALRKYEKKDVL